jgi:hypothetical protein
MAELAALNVKITGDATGLNAAVTAAKGNMTELAAASTRAGMGVSNFSGQSARAGSAAGGFANSLRGVSQQLSQVGQQTMASGNFIQALAIQLPDIGLAFGAVGAAAGLLAGVALPMLISAFSSTSENATALASALEELTGATEDFRISAAAIRLGIDEREVVIVEALHAATAKLNGEISRLNANRGSQASVDAARAEVQALEQQLALYRKRRTEAEQAASAATAMKELQQQIAGIDISGPWNAVLGSIQNAIAKANEYRAAMAPGALARQGDDGRGDQRSTVAGSRTVMPDQPWLSGGGGGRGGGGGGGLASQLQTEIEAMQQALMSQEQLQAESFARQQETLDQALQQRLITQEEYQRMMQQAQATHDFAMTQSVNKGVGDTLSALGSLFQGSKKISAAIAVANSWLAFTEVLKDPAYVGRPWARIAAAGQALAAGLNAVRNIKSASSGGGGGGGGGSGAGGGAAAAPAQQNVQTLNFTLSNDPFGFGERIVRQLAGQLNEATRNGTQIRANVLT